MLFTIDDSIANDIISQSLSPSQRTYLSKQRMSQASDFLLLKPQRYIRRQYSVQLGNLKPNEWLSLVGKVRSITKKTIRKKLTVFNALLQTEHCDVPIVWFNQHYVLEKLSNTPWVVVLGKFDDAKMSASFNVSQFELYPSLNATDYGQVMPVYSDIRGVSNRVLTLINKRLLAKLTTNDLLPKKVIESEGLISIDMALNYFHFPKNQAQVALSIKRFSFDELFIYMFPRRARYKTSQVMVPSFSIALDDGFTSQYLANLPYSLTNAQQRVWTNIKSDFNENKTVFRLIQGDVGSGKTDIAILSLLAAVGSGYKAAMLVPTEILASQHYLKLQDRCEGLGIPIYLLKGKQRKKDRQVVLDALQSDVPLIVVGTHALVQDSIELTQLAMVVVDEQHRFGVFQRQALLEKSSKAPHCLFMSATPIPRTLMLTHYGDLDHDVIDELPPGRKPPKTYYSKLNRLTQVYEFIRLELQATRQAYVVFPLIEASDHLDEVAPAVEGFEELSDVFSEFRVGLLHGKMPNSDKEHVMSLFKNNEINILVSTTVIEVGVDVPNASTMVIMNAERFGLSQLHQLRGRVGRGNDQAHCFLIADAKSVESRQRIKAMQASSNGFDLAEEDLKIRGPGNLLGTQQSGELSFSFADLSNKAVIQRIIAISDHFLVHSDDFTDIIQFLEAKNAVSSALLN